MPSALSSKFLAGLLAAACGVCRAGYYQISQAHGIERYCSECCGSSIARLAIDSRVEQLISYRSDELNDFYQDTDNSGGTRRPLNALVIRSIFPAAASVDDNGKTTGPMLVEYEVIDKGVNLTAGNLEIDEGNRIAFQLPVSDLTPGVHQLAVPGGIQLRIPVTGVLFSVRRADGTESSVSMDVHRGECGNRAAQLTSATPQFSMEGSDDLQITLSGARLDSLKRIFARRAPEAWQSLAITPIGPTEASVTIPSGLLAIPGFIQLSSIGEERSSIAFLVASKSLPVRGHGPVLRREKPDPNDGTISALLPEDLEVSDRTLSVTGSGLKEGMQVVLGLAMVPGFELPTQFDSETSLSAYVPSYPGASDDLAVFLLSVDRTAISVGYDLSSGGRYKITEDSLPDLKTFPHVTITEKIPPGEVALTDILTELTPYCGESQGTSTIAIRARGIHLSEGTPVTLRTIAGNRRNEIVTVPLTNVEVVSASPDLTDASAQHLVTEGTITIPESVFAARQTKIVIRAAGKASGSTSSTMQLTVED